jgi:hypothetical protein
MEYDEETFRKSKHFVDTSKADLINSLGKDWILLDCQDQKDKEVCEMRKELAFNYGSDFMKIRTKLLECDRFMDEIGFATHASREFEKCVDVVERSLRVTIESYYEKFVGLNK